MTRRTSRRACARALGAVLVAACASAFGAQGVLAQGAPDPEAACAALASRAGFPVASTQITLAKFNRSGTTSDRNGTPLPDHCQVQGIINKRVGVDGLPYGDRFEVRLPAP